jgi:hypothetical protein
VIRRRVDGRTDRGTGERQEEDGREKKEEERLEGWEDWRRKETAVVEVRRDVFLCVCGETREQGKKKRKKSVNWRCISAHNMEKFH